MVTGTLLCILIGAVSSKVVDDSSYRIVLSEEAIPVMDHVSTISFEDSPPSGMDIDIIIPSGANASFDDVVNGSGTINDVSFFDDAVVEDKPSTVDDRNSKARR
jgi:hypothetical protein